VTARVTQTPVGFSDRVGAGDHPEYRLFHRTIKTKRCLSPQMVMAMTHQLVLSARKKWRKLNDQNRLPEMIQGAEFRDGIKHKIKAA
jgi:hypothetical protein